MSHNSCSDETYSLVNNSQMWQRLRIVSLFIPSFFLLVIESPKVLAVPMAAKVETTFPSTTVTKCGCEIIFGPIRCVSRNNACNSQVS